MFSDRCSECTGLCRRVDGDGPLPNRILFIGEAPGREEDRGGRPFIGQSGQEFNDNYLRLAGLDRDDIRIVNTVRCRPPQNRKPTPREIKSCSTRFLPEELADTSPDVVVLMGATPCSLIPDINLTMEHGIPRQGRIFDWRGVVVPMYHPAAGMHDTSKMIPLLEDFANLRENLNGVVRFHKPSRGIKCELVNGRDSVLSRFAYSGYKTPTSVGVDTESHNGEPFSIQFSYEQGTAYMLRVDTPYLAENKIAGKLSDVERFGSILNCDPRLTTILHNAPGDLDFLARFNIHPRNVRDTMQEAYHLGNLPQGLKALAYRLLGVRMHTWEDVVKPWSERAAMDWMVQALWEAEANLQQVTLKHLKTKVKEIRKAGKVEAGMKRIIRSTINPEYDIWEKLEELASKAPGEWGHVVNTLGEPPSLGIGNVPLEEAIQYGCGDADMTLQVAHKLEEIRKNIVQEEWSIAHGDEDR